MQNRPYVLALGVDHDDRYFLHLTDIQDLLIRTDEVPRGLCGLDFKHDFAARCIRYF